MLAQWFALLPGVQPRSSMHGVCVLPWFAWVSTGYSSSPTAKTCSPRTTDENEPSWLTGTFTQMSLNVINVIHCPCQVNKLNETLCLHADSLDGLPRSACKRPKLEVNLDEWDLSGLPWWFLGNLRSNYGRRSNGSTDIHTNQVRAPGEP